MLDPASGRVPITNTSSLVRWVPRVDQIPGRPLGIALLRLAFDDQVVEGVHDLRDRRRVVRQELAQRVGLDLVDRNIRLVARIRARKDAWPSERNLLSLIHISEPTRRTPIS